MEKLKVCNTKMGDAMPVTGRQEQPSSYSGAGIVATLKDDNRAIHAKEHQIAMHVPSRRPACYSESDTSPRGEIVEGWPDGVKPGLRNPFADNGRSCQNASTPELWEIALTHTPGCFGCQRAQRALDIAEGKIQSDE